MKMERERGKKGIVVLPDKEIECCTAELFSQQEAKGKPYTSVQEDRLVLWSTVYI